MPMNLPEFDVQNFSIGPAIIYIGNAGCTPTTCLGAVTDSSLKITVEINKFLLGVPSAPQWNRFKSVETVLTVKGLEWNLEKIQKVLGGYLVSDDPSAQTLYGTFEHIEPFSVRLVHQTPSGGTLTVDFFAALPGGGLDFSFGYKVHEIPFTFNAIVATQDFEGNALPPNTTFKMKLELPS